MRDDDDRKDSNTVNFCFFLAFSLNAEDFRETRRRPVSSLPSRRENVLIRRDDMT
jgi:hypothetical protein